MGILTAYRYVLLVALAVVSITVPSALLLASLLAIRRTSFWVGACLVGGSGTTLLCALPSVLFFLLPDLVIPQDYSAALIGIKIIGFLGSVAFAAGFFGLVLQSARKPKPIAGGQPVGVQPG